jgi:hypothetical protein
MLGTLCASLYFIVNSPQRDASQAIVRLRTQKALLPCSRESALSRNGIFSVVHGRRPLFTDGVRSIP